VVTVGGGGFEGPIDPSDFQALHIPLEQLRGHLITLITLGLEAVAKSAPQVSFIHDYPGAVDTPLTQQVLSVMNEAAAIDGGPVPELITAEESGERHVYLLTSPRYPAAEGGNGTASLGNASTESEFVRGIDGKLGSGVYTVGFDGESAPAETLEFLAELRREGMIERVWKHTEDEFVRITGERA
jgi:hypothetical protein